MNDTRYSDVKNDAWYAVAVEDVSAAGLMEGYEDGTFRPNESMTRAEVATVLWRLLNKLGVI